MKDQITASALNQITCCGFRKFTMDSIASELGISKKTIYRHFETKEQIVTAVVDEIVLQDQRYNEGIRHMEGSALQKIERIIAHEECDIAPWIWNELKQSYPKEWAKIEAVMEANKNLVIRLINDGVDAGDFQPGIDAVVLGALVNKVQELILDMKFLVRNNLTMDSLLKTVRQVFLMGILSESRREIYRNEEIR